jgi:hypothetical protein
LTPAQLLVYGVLAVITGAVLYRFRRFLLRGIPDLSATALGLFRLALGAALLYGMNEVLRLPDAAAPGGNADEAILWQSWGWVDYLAGHWNVRDAFYVATLVAIVAFTAGLFARLAYVAVVVGFLVRLLVAQEYGSVSHVWVLYPLVLVPLVVVPWGDGLSVDELIRRRRGLPSAARPPGPRYGVAVWLPGLALGIVWLAAAAAKLGRSGIEWATEGAVRYHWAEDHLSAPVSWGAWIAGHEAVAIAFSVAGLATEALFITHVLFRNEWVRLAYGLAGLGLLAGFYLFQGVFWFPWWSVLLVFLPWQAIASAIDSRAVGSAATRAMPDARWYAALAGIVAVMLVQQVAISRGGIEQMPFFSNYPMYSNTSASPEAFNRQRAPVKWYRYTILREDGTDITAEADSLGLATAIQDVVAWRLREPDLPLDPGLQQALAEAHAVYEQETGERLASVRVAVDRREFDFTGGELRDLADPAPVELDLSG